MTVLQSLRNLAVGFARCKPRGAPAAARMHVEVPEKPKKPVTPWISFVRERKDEVLRQRGKMSASQLSVILAQEWKHTDKAKYEQEYKQKHEEYMRLVEDYQNSLTPEQIDQLDLRKSAKRESKAMKQLRKTNPPVMPRNPANLYCHERSKQDDFKEMLKHKKAAQVFSDIFKEYRQLSDAEKQKYIEMQEEDKARFQKEFLAWYESVQANENLTKAAREQANMMRERLVAMNYI
jgi:transcription factor A